MSKVALIYIIILLISQFQHKIFRFPDVNTEIKSPDGKYLLYNKDYDNLNYNHALYFKKINENVEFSVIKYQRYIDVIWSPDSKYFSITNYIGSDNSNVYLYKISDNKQSLDSISIFEVLKKNYSKDKHIFLNHHVYITTEKWLNSNKLLIKIEGYGDIDPNGFEYKLIYNVNNQSIKLKK